MAKPPVKAEGLARTLEAQIRSGVYAVGEWLPSERQLASTHELGRPTVQQALAMLDRTGLVEAVTGAGVRVVATGLPSDEAPAVLDANVIYAELRAIRQELRDLNARLARSEGPDRVS